MKTIKKISKLDKNIGHHKNIFRQIDLNNI